MNYTKLKPAMFIQKNWTRWLFLLRAIKRFMPDIEVDILNTTTQEFTGNAGERFLQFDLVVLLKSFKPDVNALSKLQKINSHYRKALARMEWGETNISKITFNNMGMSGAADEKGYALTFYCRFQLEENTENIEARTFERAKPKKVRIDRDALTAAVSNANAVSESDRKVESLMGDFEQQLEDK